MKSMDNCDVKVIILSCDKYEDAWIPCIKSIKKYWNDCPYEIVLLTEKKSAPSDAGYSRTINVDVNEWTTRLNKALDDIDCDYVITFLEDQWPVENVNQVVVSEAVQYIMQHSDVGGIYFEPSKIGGVKNAVQISEMFNEIPMGAPYRLSCAPGIFKKEFLKKVTAVPESAWDFERVRSFDKIGDSYRLLEINGINWVRLDELGAITRGKWVVPMREYSQIIGVKVDYNVRPELSRIEIIKGKIKAFIFNINPSLIVKIQKCFSK